MAREDPASRLSVINKLFQKRRLRRQFQDRVSEAATRAVAEKLLSASKRVFRAVGRYLRRNPAVSLVILISFLLVLLTQSCAGGALVIGNALTGAIGGASFLATDEDIDEAELRYSEWEVDLALKARNAPFSYPGYNEYRYDIAETGHDPYALLAFLTARHNDFAFKEVEDELLAIFYQQYVLTFTGIVEVRSYTETVSTPGGGSSTRTVYYNYYILSVTLTARPFEDVISPLLATRDERERYAAYMYLHGNRQYIGSPFVFNWLPHVTSYYGYRIHPVSGVKDYHEGVDISAPIGTPIKAGGKGVVSRSGLDGGYGLALMIDYGNGVAARYAHCSALLASVGHEVITGEIIALSGDTGTSTGPHLHMEIMKNARYLNPLYFVGGTID